MNPPVHILAVDDRVENLVALESLLDEPDWKVVRATSGNDALAAVLEQDFALVLLDVQMPEMNGFETAQLMRAHPKTRRLPIIFVTAISREQKYVFEGYESGAVDYIAKPIDPLILKSKVRVFAELYRQRCALEEANRELAARNKQLQEEMDLARKVQLGFLPDEFPRRDRIEFGRYYLICSTLGGDLFDAFPLGDRHVGLYMADVSGHGVGAALYAGLVKMGFESMKSEAGLLFDPSRAMGKLNDLMADRLGRDWFVTVFYGLLDLEANVLTWANAGHPPPIRVPAATREPSFCNGCHGPAIGLLTDAEFPTGRIDFAPSDKLVLYTDGIPEAMSRGEEFGEDRLMAAIRASCAEPPDILIRGILVAVEAHRNGAPVSDDCSILVVELR